MSIYITGDIHGDIDISKLNKKQFPQQSQLTKKDYVIICGDFGLVWNNSNQDKYWQKWLNNKSFTTLFADGNHENFELLNNYPIQMWNGGKVHKISNSIFHLMRGQVFNIDNHKFFTMGGASSTDKEFRKEHISWWKDELPNKLEYKEGLDNLQKNNFKIDYIITHCCSSSLLKTVSYYCRFNKYGCKTDNLNNYLDILENKCQFKHWYFGHYHMDISNIIDKHTLLYNNLIKIN